MAWELRLACCWIEYIYFMHPDKERQKMLELIAEYADKHGGLDFPTPTEILLQEKLRTQKAIDQRRKALLYLVALDYLKVPKGEAGGMNLVLSEKGIEAYHADYFTEQYKSKIRKVWNNFFTLLFSGIVAGGVVYSIFKGDGNSKVVILCKKLQSGSSVCKDTTPTYLNHSEKDSTKHDSAAKVSIPIRRPKSD